jgi:hypothetical protein|tara:strand:- start:8898 stop:9113 length:216 start_codon:yes stop_codon:yes gene_type:complete
MLSQKCKVHLDEVNMTRWQHFWHAIKVAWRLERAATRVVIHAFVPRWYTTYASDEMRKILAEQELAMSKGK